MNQTHDTTSKHRPGRRLFFSPSRIAMLWAALVVFVTAGYFQNSRAGWNASTQFALTCAIVERGTLSIDAYHARPEFKTNDKALFQGHYYCDKSPVTAFLGVPVFWLYSSLTRGLLGRPLSYNAARYWVTWWVNGLAAALLAAMTAALLMRRAVNPAPAAVAAALWILATPILPYSILFFSYLPACTLAMGGFLIIERLWNPKEACGVNQNLIRNLKSIIRDPHSAIFSCFLGGLLLGLAAWALNTLALAALILTLGVALAPARDNRQRLVRLAGWALGGLVGVCGNFIYTRAVFHSWGTPYAYEAEAFFREHMAKGLMGATWPRPQVAWLITFHPFQGLFYWFPVALAALGGAVWLLARGRHAQRLESALALAILGGLVLYNSGYFLWWGGCGYAPRHLIPALPLLSLGLAPWLSARQPLPRRIFWMLGLAGLALNLPAVAVNPQQPMQPEIDLLMNLELVSKWPSPMRELQWVFWKMGYTDANWGTALGLHGPISMLPLLTLWAASAAILAYLPTQVQPTSPATSGRQALAQESCKNRIKEFKP